VLLSQPYKQNLSVYSHNAWIAESLKCIYCIDDARRINLGGGGERKSSSTFVR